MSSSNLENFSNELINQKETNFTQQSNNINPQTLTDIPNNSINSENIIQGNSIAHEDKNAANDLSDENDDNNRKHLKRRSKKEVEGRNYICRMCNKSYLSYPALYTHYKQKHNTNNSSGRGRGRPKKLSLESNQDKNSYNPQNQTFFSKEDRTGKTETENEINNCIIEAFNDLYNIEQKNRLDERNMKFYYNIDEHPFLSKFKQDPHDLNKLLGDEHQVADLVFIEYLNKMSAYCNPTYYAKLIKFVILFREHSNIINCDKNRDNINGKDKEFTEFNDAEDVPDASNEFITDFLDPEGKNNDFGFTKEECIDLTQNLCYWMYENNFTCSKLSLINENK